MLSSSSAAKSTHQDVVLRGDVHELGQPLEIAEVVERRVRHLHDAVRVQRKLGRERHTKAVEAVGAQEGEDAVHGRVAPEAVGEEGVGLETEPVVVMMVVVVVC